MTKFVLLKLLFLNFLMGLSIKVFANICKEPVLIPKIKNQDELHASYNETLIKKLVRSQASKDQIRFCAKSVRYKFDDRLELDFKNNQPIVKCKEPVKIPVLGPLAQNKKLLQRIVYRYSDDFQKKWCFKSVMKFRFDSTLGDWSEYESRSETEGRSSECYGFCNQSKGANKSSDLSAINQWLERSSARSFTCRPLGYSNTMNSNKQNYYRTNKSSLEDAIARYSERAQGAILRGYMALVKPGYEEEARVKTNNFTSFDHLSPAELKRLLYGGENQNGKCYQYIKAALSGDYSLLSKRPLQFNRSLINQYCGGLNSRQGDLVEKHWLYNNDKNYGDYSAGSSGPALEKRGYINLMDSKYGVHHKYFSEETAPEGAILVRRCAVGGRLLPEFSGNKGDCHGHIGIKTSSGVIGGDSFRAGKINPAIEARRVLVGIYIKPTEG